MKLCLQPARRSSRCTLGRQSLSIKSLTPLELHAFSFREFFPFVSSSFKLLTLISFLPSDASFPSIRPFVPFSPSKINSLEPVLLEEKLILKLSSQLKFQAVQPLRSLSNSLLPQLSARFLPLLSSLELKSSFKRPSVND